MPPAGSTRGFKMKIEITFNSGEKAVVYGMSPVTFAEALLTYAWADKLDFQDKASIEAAVLEYNTKRVVQ